MDLINAVTIPSLSEALGIALAIQQSRLPYTIGFVLNEQANLLDGTPLLEAIQQIDQATVHKSLGYIVTCTHLQKLKGQKKYERLIGLQANGSSLPAKQLAVMKKPVADTPKQFTQGLIDLKKQFGLKTLGGCCGTGREHLAELVESLQPLLKNANRSV